ncbi:MAG: hypothetical protein QG600_141 [Patescibacteria group bacterium]|nr:hypothetical protein [Patescibacteria group bacterium]
MKLLLPKLLLVLSIAFIFFLIPQPVHAQEDELPQVGAWIRDAEVTKIGKNASRSGMLLDWTLRDYRWTAQNYDNATNPLIPFWQVVQRIVFALFLVVIMITSFILIVTRGKSLSAKRFLPRFLLVILLVTFSFSLVQFLYQIIDIFQGFFLRNPQGAIISSRDLLFIGFDYRTFEGLRRFGTEFDETAFTSLLFVKLTAFTYYVMAILLIIRKIILWFFLIISPVFPILLLFYPVRNTGKIWIGEFFRWLMYAPLFAIFLSGLVRLWQTSLPLFFNPAGIGDKSQIIYPTAVNILLGGPGQKVGINNSVNLPDTFALYLVSLIMLWIVIILPFILLQIFLDYMMSFNYRESPAYKQMLGLINSRIIPPANPKTPIVPVGPANTGLARNLPFARKYTAPANTGLAREIPRATSISQKTQVNRPTSIARSQTTKISQLTSLSIPTMRDIARFEKEKITSKAVLQREKERTSNILKNIANPTQVSTPAERERFRQIRESLVAQSKQGDQISTSILNAAGTIASYSSSNTSTQSNQSFQTILQQLANPSTVTNTSEREKIIEIREKLNTVSNSSKEYVKTILSNISSVTNETKEQTSLQSVLQKLSNTEKISTEKERVQYEKLREKITDASRSGNQLATLIKESLDKSTSVEQVKFVQQELIKAQSLGNPLATEILKTASSSQVSQTVALTNVLEKITHSELIQNEKERIQYQSLYEKLIKESKSGNQTATKIVKSIENKLSVQDIQNIHTELLQSSSQNNPLATEILQRTQNSTSTADWDSEKIRTQLEEAKKQGDPLATLLLGLISQKQSTMVSVPLSATVKAKAGTFPVVNRIQQVSLDDYEAVKKMWKENYKELDVPENINGRQTRKEWITSDMTEIEKTISLLTSQNESDIEEGMKEVADILPFLLIGGFSQTEIVAYLKAKLEAGKSVMEDVQEEIEEDETLLDTERKSTQTVRHMSADVAREISDSSDRPQTDSILTSPTLINSSPVSTSNIQNDGDILNLVNLTLPTMKDIVIFEKEKYEKNNSQDHIVSQVLSSLAHPETLIPSEKEKYEQIRQQLQRESSKGNKTAESLLSATSLTESESLSESEALTFFQFVENSVNQTNTDTLSSDEKEIQKTLHSSELKQDAFVERLNNFIQEVRQLQGNEMIRFANKLSRPQEIGTATEKIEITKLIERLHQEESSHEFASQLLQMTKGTLTEEKANELQTFVMKSSESGDPLAQYIVMTLLTPSKETIDKTMSFYKEVIKEKGLKHPIASRIIDGFDKKQRSKKFSPFILPLQNRLQQVSLDDYEAVKKMWYEIYLHSDVPKLGENEQTREEWIQGDQKQITDVINLLSSSNPNDVQDGLDLVRDILPFLLIGGFSKEEVIGYLKAKLEAGKMALETLKAIEEGEETKVDISIKKSEILNPSLEAEEKT